MGRASCPDQGGSLMPWTNTNDAKAQPISSSRKPQKDFESHLSSLDNVPLFMKDLPTDGSEDTLAIDALQSLTFDGTPDGQCGWECEASIPG